jgi:hypothetical protein
VVGRELLTTCPDGEDHRRHEQGDTTEEVEEEEEEQVFGARIHEWRKSTVKRRITTRRIITDGSSAMAEHTCDK